MEIKSFLINRFVSDPDGDITKIKLIDPADYKKYFDWKATGERVMELSLQYLKSYNRNKENRQQA